MAGYRHPFSIEEDTLILKAIIEVEAYYRLRGTIFWKELESTELFARTGRTWQSLKERFLKQIVPNIFNPRYKLPDVDKHMIQVGYLESAKGSRIRK